MAESSRRLCDVESAEVLIAKLGDEKEVRSQKLDLFREILLPQVDKDLPTPLCDASSRRFFAGEMRSKLTSRPSAGRPRQSSQPPRAAPERFSFGWAKSTPAGCRPG